MRSAASSTQVGVDKAQLAHLLLPISADIERFGIARCGYPAEYLTLVPDLGWAEVLLDRRCPHCEADHAVSAGAEAVQ